MANTKRATDVRPLTPSLDQEDNITLRNATESPLLRLPAELRNQIYEYALVPPDFWYGYGCPFDLLRVCRQTQDEAGSILYSRQIFTFDSAVALGRFVCQLSTSQRNAIRTIQISRASHSQWEHFDINNVTRLHRLGGLQTILVEDDRLAQIVRSWRAGIKVIVEK